MLASASEHFNMRAWDAYVSTVVVRFDVAPSRPIAPAALYVEAHSGHERFQLHRLVRIQGAVLTFETFNSTQSLPSVGSSYFFRSWWVRRAMEAALDVETPWTRSFYPDDGSHEHCLFSWASIEAGTENAEGYYSKYGWITVRSFEAFIRDDVYGVRQSVDAEPVAPADSLEAASRLQGCG
jgi:hypothetical protein